MSLNVTVMQARRDLFKGSRGLRGQRIFRSRLGFRMLPIFLGYIALSAALEFLRSAYENLGHYWN